MQLMPVCQDVQTGAARCEHPLGMMAESDLC